MGMFNSPAAKGCAILVAVPIVGLLLILGVVGVKTWVPLHEAGRSLEELDQSLGGSADYIPVPSGEIPADRLELFLELRSDLVGACGDYGRVRKGFDSVESLDSKESGDLGDVGDLAKDFGGASLAITPFLARFFEARNEALLAVSMSLQEYSYIYAVAYHEQLLSDQTLNEIFSDGEAVSPEAAIQLKACLARQRDRVAPGDESRGREVLEVELARLEKDPSRLIWQEGLPEAIQGSVAPYRDRLDSFFCGATAGLEMERDADRALRVALE